MITKEEFEEYCSKNNLRYKFENKYCQEYRLKSNWNIIDLFMVLCRYGYIETLKWFLTKEKINIHGNNEEAFMYSCIDNHLEVAKWLIEISKENNKIINIHFLHDLVFRFSCWNGYIEIAKWLIEISKESGEIINIHANNDDEFKKSCKWNNLEIAKWLCSLCDEYYIEIENNRIVKYGIKNMYHTYLDENKGIKKVIKRLQLKVI